MNEIIDIEDIQNKITQSLLWLGIQNIEFEKRFSAKKFENNNIGEDVYETNISFVNNKDILPDRVAENIVAILEKVVDYHKRKRTILENGNKVSSN